MTRLLSGYTLGVVLPASAGCELITQRLPSRECALRLILLQGADSPSAGVESSLSRTNSRLQAYSDFARGIIAVSCEFLIYVSSFRIAWVQL